MAAPDPADGPAGDPPACRDEAEGVDVDGDDDDDPPPDGAESPGNGTEGTGLDGLDGAGLDGTGTFGTLGTDGTGTDGTDGTEGTGGSEGTEGSDGTDGTGTGAELNRRQLGARGRRDHDREHGGDAEPGRAQVALQTGGYH